MAGHRTPLTIKQILAWADAHHERTGNWPATTTGPVHEAPDEGWRAIDDVLRRGLRQLPGGSSLAQVLARQRKVVNRSSRPRLTVKQILAWADAHHKRTGNWPAQRSGPVYEAPDERWKTLDDALRQGYRKLPGGLSLAQRLARHRKVVNLGSRPRLSVKQILAWADSHHKRTGRWPVQLSGPVYEAPDEAWKAIDKALKHGYRKLPGGLSLAQILARDRKVRNATSKPRLTVKQILAWADAHHERTGKWPEDRNGPIHEAPDETWPALSQALRSGRRGLPRGGSLARLLARHGRKRNRLARPRLSIKQILAWADAHHLRTGKWPTRRSGKVRGERGETWRGIDNAMRAGYRGLPGGQSLPKLLFERRGVRHHQGSPPLTVQQILTWADAHNRRTGEWPTNESGDVYEPSGRPTGENWAGIKYALTTGRRSLDKTSLRRLLAERRGVRHRLGVPRLKLEDILAWADAHHRRTGRWPKRFSGKVYGTRAEKWLNIDSALRDGFRGFSGGYSLAKLLSERRGVRYFGKPPPLTVEQILSWADAHHRRTGEWPKRNSGEVCKPSGRPAGETWAAISIALAKGTRSLDRTTLRRLLAERRGVRHNMALPRLKLKDILAWADAHRRRTGKWPTLQKGAITEAPGETWGGINSALNSGARWRGARTSLAYILVKYRNKRHAHHLPRLTIKQVLAWADAHQQRTGNWPTLRSGTVLGSSGESWIGINAGLVEGIRGFQGGSSLARLLEQRRGVRNIHHLPRLTIKQILTWADAHRKRTRRWPKHYSGSIPRTGGETWHRVQSALSTGGRGLRSGNSLPKVLERHRGVRNIGDLPALRIQQILRWADSHHKRTGKWPKLRSGAIPEAPGEKWSTVNQSLAQGLRGLRQGSSLPRLLNKHRGVRNRSDLPKLSTKQILKWADAYYKLEKGWPTTESGKIPRTGGETWVTINYALRNGTRGMSGGWSLARFLNRYRRPERGL